MARPVRLRSREPPAGDRDWPVEVNPVLLFRFSALTYNAHRIHYDRDYARAEGYPGLVVHGPLQALLMAELARPQLPARRDYSYRLVAPLYDGPGPGRVGCSGRRRGPGVVPRRRGPRHRHRRDQARPGPDRPGVTAAEISRT